MRKSLFNIYFVASLSFLLISHYCCGKQDIDQSICVKHIHFVFESLAVFTYIKAQASLKAT